MKFLTLLSLILIVAKIFGLITSGWIMCLIPFIIALVIKVLIFIIMAVILIVASVKDNK